MIDADQINAAYDWQKAAIQNLADCTALELNVRTLVEEKKAELLSLGVIDGKNAETREGQLRERLSAEHRQLADVQGEVAKARTGLSVAQLEVERCKTLLKLLEITSP